MYIRKYQVIFLLIWLVLLLHELQLASDVQLLNTDYYGPTQLNKKVSNSLFLERKSTAPLLFQYASQWFNYIVIRGLRGPQEVL